MDKYFLDKANLNMPKLYSTEITARQTVQIVPDASAFFGFSAAPAGEIPEVWQTGDCAVIDFNTHCVGQLSFTLRHDNAYLDAPVRLKLRFGEIPYELARDFSDYRGSLCASWLQEEIITVDEPGVITLPRRYCFRYLEITVLASPRRLRMTDFAVCHVSSADRSRLAPLPEGTDPLLVKIDAVAAKTLMDCMQTAYEDGPKRDRRLWTGDLRLQALTDYYLFGNHRLARRCLYLFAACEEENKFLPGCLYQKPNVYFDEGMGIADYALLYTVALCDYYEHTGDMETAAELFPVARRQIEHALSLVDENGVMGLGEGWNSFIDWAKDLRTNTAVQGVLLYALERMAGLAEAVCEPQLAAAWREKLDTLRIASYKALFDPQKNAFCNAYDQHQYAVQAQVWMILGGVIDGEQAVSVLKQSLSAPDSIKPVTPYMHHYVVEALMKLGQMEDALSYIRRYWGGMVEQGADSFWEVYVPEDAAISPYGDVLIHSFCHAWSCSASYFIRKYFI